MKLKGRIAFRDIETGVWVLEAEDGSVYQLAGGDRGIKKNGRAVEIEGDLDPDAHTAQLAGPVLHVRQYTWR